MTCMVVEENETLNPTPLGCDLERGEKDGRSGRVRCGDEALGLVWEGDKR
jgi:hypothetical protein